MCIGLLAAGCGEDGDTIIFQGSGGDLSGNDDNIPGLSTVASNNKAPDGGGLSPNDADVVEWSIKFNCGGDNSAIVMFQVQDGTAFRVYASHYNGSNLTPPVELLAYDRDEATQVNLSSYVCVPLNTSGYNGDGSSANAAAINGAKSNNGNWLILGEYTTLNQDLALSQNHTTANAEGVRHALGYWTFIKSERDKGHSTVDVGSNAEGTAAGLVGRSFRYGFMEVGQLVNVGNPEGGSAAGSTPSGAGASPAACPANDVTSYGVVSDTLSGTACFGGNSLPLDDGAGGGTANYRLAKPFINATYTDPDYEVGDDTTFITVVWTQIVNSRSDEGVGYMATNAGGTSLPHFAGGESIQLRHRTFRLDTMSFDGATDTRINMPAGITPTSDNRSDAATSPYPTFYVCDGMLFFKYVDASLCTPISSTTAVSGLLLGVQEADGPYDWTNGESLDGGHLGAGISAGAGVGGFNYWSEYIAVQRFADNGDATTAPASTMGSSGTGANDVSIPQGATFANHSTTAGPGSPPSVNLSGVDVYNGRNMANFGDNVEILGPDCGSVEYGLFFLQTDNTRATLANSQNGNENINTELWAVAINGGNASIPNGTIVAGALMPGINPCKVSAHQEDYPDDPTTASPQGDTSLSDPIIGNFWQANLNRTGDWAVVSYRQNQGLSMSQSGGAGSFHVGLMAVAYQVQHPASGTNSPSDTPVNVEDRFTFDTIATTGNSPGSPHELTNTASTMDIQTATARTQFGGPGTVEGDANTFSNWRRVPVNSWKYQGKFGKGGFQSNAQVAHVLFEQSDSTNDRVFLRQFSVDLSVSPPTMTVGGVVEVDTSAVNGVEPARSNASGSVRNVNAVQNAFLDTEVGTGLPNFYACDIGPTATSSDPQILVVYRKIVDDTGDTIDGDGGDANVKATVIDCVAGSGGLATGFVICRNLDVDNGVTTPVDPLGGGAGDYGNYDDPTDSYYSINTTNVDSVNSVANVVEMKCVPINTSSANFPTAGSGSKVVVIMTDRVGGETTDPATGVQTAQGNASGRTGLFSRTVVQFSSSLTTADALFTPSAVAATFAMPWQIDHEQGVSDDVNSLLFCCQSGNKLAVAFEANDQWWLNVFDGSKWLTTNGISNPLLITNDSSQNVLQAGDVLAANVNATVNVEIGPRFVCCEDANGNEVSSAVMWIKFDNAGQGSGSGIPGDVRLRARFGKFTN